MKTRLIVGCMALLGASVMLAGPGAAVAQPGGGGFMRGGGGSAMFLLMNEKVRAELEVVDDQVAELTTMQEEAQNEMRDMFQGMRGGGGDMEDMRQKMQDKMKEYQERLDTILLPHQQQRLKQLAFQSQSRGRAAGTLLNSDEIKDELGITAEQEDKMKEAAEKAQEEYRAQLMKLQREAEEKVLAVLSAEQQKKYRELVGEPFDFGEPQGFGGRGGQGGGRGGRGGQNGGGRSDF